MNWPRLRTVLVNTYHEQPQQVARIDSALRQAQEGLQTLASLGHQFHLAAGSEPPGDEWPRLVFHLEAAPRGFLCLCRQDRELLGEGWFDTLDEAKHAKGMDQQFRRGGIFPKRGLPALPQDYKPSRIDQEENRRGSR